MRKRNISRHIRFSEEEAAELDRKVQIAGLGESALVRLLIAGYDPKPKPDRYFYDAMIDLNASINRLSKAVEAHKADLSDEVNALRKLRIELQRRYLMPERSDLKWR